jgi:hypothetical protein
VLAFVTAVPTWLKMMVFIIVTAQNIARDGKKSHLRHGMLTDSIVVVTQQISGILRLLLALVPHLLDNTKYLRILMQDLCESGREMM